jgi:hypothetical protein
MQQSRRYVRGSRARKWCRFGLMYPRPDGRAADPQGVMPQWRSAYPRGRINVRLPGERNQPGANPNCELVAREGFIGYPEYNVDGLGLFGVDLEAVE